jgi:RNase P/RNase MRP subunit p29
MTVYDVPELLGLGLDYQHLEKYIGCVVRVKVLDDRKSKGIVGRLATLTDRFIELIHSDGRTTIVRIDQITVISKVRGAV